MHEQGGLLSEAEVEDLLSDTSLFEMPDNEVARQLHLLVTIPWASDEKLSREPGPASGSVWVRQVEALRRVRAYGFEEDERSAPRPEAKIIDLTELDEADGNESELSDLTELDEDEVELPKIAAAPESVVESSDDEEQVPQRRKRTSAKAYIESSDSSEKDDDGDVKKQVAVKSKKKIGKARSVRGGASMILLDALSDLILSSSAKTSPSRMTKSMPTMSLLFCARYMRHTPRLRSHTRSGRHSVENTATR